MVAKWAFNNVDGGRVADARVYEREINLAFKEIKRLNKELSKANKEIGRLDQLKIKAETALVEQNKAVARMNQLVRELIADGIVDRADAKARLVRIQAK